MRAVHSSLIFLIRYRTKFLLFSGEAYRGSRTGARGYRPPGEVIGARRPAVRRNARRGRGPHHAYRLPGMRT
jgi:hypothetical protein